MPTVLYKGDGTEKIDMLVICSVCRSCILCDESDITASNPYESTMFDMFGVSVCPQEQVWCDTCGKQSLIVSEYKIAVPKGVGVLAMMTMMHPDTLKRQLDVQTADAKRNK